MTQLLINKEKNMTTIKTGTSLFAAAIAYCAFLAPAFADTSQQHDDGAFAFKFAYDAKELQSREGAEALLGRLHSQVARHCQSAPRESLTERKQTRACVDETMANTISEIGSTPLADAFGNRTAG